MTYLMLQFIFLSLDNTEQSTTKVEDGSMSPVKVEKKTYSHIFNLII